MNGIQMKMDRGNRSRCKKACSKRRATLCTKLLVFVGGIFGLIVEGRKQSKPPPTSLLKIQPDYPSSATKNKDDGIYHAKPEASVAKLPTDDDRSSPSAPPTKEPPPPPPPEPFLELNSQNPISKDVSRLWHNAEMGAVCLTIPRNAECSHPLLIGRLSGPSLAILEWTTTATGDDDTNNTDDNSTTFCGKYNGASVIQGAVYFVEVLTAYCKDFSVGALSPSAKTSSSATSSSPRHTDKWLSFNWTEVCMQNTLTNRLTRDNCAILISNNSTTTTTLPRDESQSRSDNNTLSQSPPPDVPAGLWIRNGKQNLIPLYSRFQPLDCQSNKKLPRCARPMSSARLDGYDFSWTSEMPQNWKAKNETYHDDLLKQCNCKPSNVDCLDGVCKVKCVNCVQEKTMPTLPITEINRKKVCIIGASHSYHLMYSIDLLRMSHFFHWIEMQFPVELQEGFFEEQYEKVGCKIFVIGFGQWPASHKSNPPYSFERYLSEMRRIAQLAQDTSEPSFQLYLRSMHHMPIGDRASACPPTDWRTPAVANAYNYLLEQAVQEAGRATTKSSSSLLASSKSKVHFLDTLFITHPMWDVAYDLYHLPRKVADLEALYIASIVLSG
ncbi:MAG: hypothetical protein SGBAC_003377 [Bacillariaceae sp.]